MPNRIISYIVRKCNRAANQRIANGRVSESANRRGLKANDADGLRPLLDREGGQGLTDLVEEAVEVDGSGTPPLSSRCACKGRR